MKKIATMIVCALGGAVGSVYAQDVIICRNGDEITSKVLKVSRTEIEYKRWSNQDGPSYTLDKSEVFMIKYQNGEKDVFKEEPVAQTETAATAEPTDDRFPSEPVLATAAADNAELIAQYNNATYEYVLRYPGKKKNKPADTILGTLGVAASSVLSTDDIEISFPLTRN